MKTEIHSEINNVQRVENSTGASRIFCCRESGTPRKFRITANANANREGWWAGETRRSNLSSEAIDEELTLRLSVTDRSNDLTRQNVMLCDARLTLLRSYSLHYPRFDYVRSDRQRPKVETWAIKSINYEADEDEDVDEEAVDVRAVLNPPNAALTVSVSAMSL